MYLNYKQAFSDMGTCPLVVDLDGTIIQTDMLHESVLNIFRTSLHDTLKMPFWLLRGKAVLKHKISRTFEFSPASLPYNKDVLNWLYGQHANGRKLILCTGSSQPIAAAIGAHLGIFAEIIASDSDINLSGVHKAALLEQRFGRAGFDYIGNSFADIAVWAQARRAIIVNPLPGLAEKAARVCEVERVFASSAGPALGHWWQVLRVHQWLKNILLFVPLLAAHQFTDVSGWLNVLLAFGAFSLCASAVYIANDLLDLENDRQHLRKRNRPFAAGAVPVWVGVLLSPVLLITSMTLANWVGAGFLNWLMLYFGITCLYSWGLKRLILIDCLTLAMLYTMRIVAGAAAAGLSLSFWILAFSVFLFLSLAYVKRYAELQVNVQQGQTSASGRGYATSDAPLLLMLGISSGYAAVVVLALYLNTDNIMRLYHTPEIVWGAVIVMIYWISWMWMQAQRGRMHDDPLVFAVKDRHSLLAGVAFVLFIGLGSVGWPW